MLFPFKINYKILRLYVANSVNINNRKCYFVRNVKSDDNGVTTNRPSNVNSSSTNVQYYILKCKEPFVNAYLFGVLNVTVC